MALNVYLTLFRNHNAEQLKGLEWRYHLMCYGGPFVVAFSLIFAESQERGKVYGDAVVSDSTFELPSSHSTDLFSSYGAGSPRSGTFYD